MRATVNLDGTEMDARQELRHLGRYIRQAVAVRQALRREWDAAQSGGAVRMDAGGKLSAWNQFIRETVNEVKQKKGNECQE